MEIINTWTGNPSLKEYRLEPTDKEEFFKLGVNEEMYERLKEYMEENDLKVRIVETYDGQSGWKGFRFILNSTDLSGNGFCFSNGSLTQFLDGTYIDNQRAIYGARHAQGLMNHRD